VNQLILIKFGTVDADSNFGEIRIPEIQNLTFLKFKMADGRNFDYC